VEEGFEDYNLNPDQLDKVSQDEDFKGSERQDVSSLSLNYGDRSTWSICHPHVTVVCSKSWWNTFSTKIYQKEVISSSQPLVTKGDVKLGHAPSVV
jgi:hypothetical protein